MLFKECVELNKVFVISNHDSTTWTPSQYNLLLGTRNLATTPLTAQRPSCLQD